MKEGGTGGQNTLTGLQFERKTDLINLIQKVDGYSIGKITKAGTEILYKKKKVATCFKKHEFYRFLDKRNVDWKKHNLKKTSS